MNPAANNPANESPDKGSNVSRRLKALKDTSVTSAPSQIAPSIPALNIPAQKLIVVQSRFNAALVYLSKNVDENHREVVRELANIKTRMVSKQTLADEFSLHQGDLDPVKQQIEALALLQKETAWRILVAAVTLGCILLALGVLVAFRIGGRL